LHTLASLPIGNSMSCDFLSKKSPWRWWWRNVRGYIFDDKSYELRPDPEYSKIYGSNWDWFKRVEIAAYHELGRRYDRKNGYPPFPDADPEFRSLLGGPGKVKAIRLSQTRQRKPTPARSSRSAWAGLINHLRLVGPDSSLHK